VAEICRMIVQHLPAFKGRLKAVNDLLSLQNKTLKEIQGRAAEIGVNITRKIRKLKSADAH